MFRHMDTSRRKDADACCRMTTSLRVRRMKAVSTGIIHCVCGVQVTVHVHRDTRLVCEMTTVIGQ